MTSSPNTSGNGRRHSRSKARLRRFTRTSLYSQNSPGGRRSRWLPFGAKLGRPPTARLRSTMSGLSHSTPPFRGLLQQVMPGDRVVVRRIETAVVNPEANVLVGVSDETTIPSETRQDREIALGHAERHVHARRIAPFGNDKPATQQQTVRSAARTHRPEGVVPWRPLVKVIRDHPAKISAPRCLVFARVTCGGGHGGGVEPGLAGCRALPGVWVGRWKISHRHSFSVGRVDFRDSGTTSSRKSGCAATHWQSSGKTC